MFLGVTGNEIGEDQGDKGSPDSKGDLCIKGRLGFDSVGHPSRLSKPLIRKEGMGKDMKVDGNFREVFREATWDEALDTVASRLKKIKEENGPDRIAFLTSAKCTNEENYLLQKLARAVVGTNHVDHCARL